METESFIAGFKCTGCNEYNPVQIGVKPLPTMCVDCWRDVMEDPRDPDSILIILRVGWKVFKDQMEKLAQRAEHEYENGTGIYEPAANDNDGAGASGGGSGPRKRKPRRAQVNVRAVSPYSEGPRARPVGHRGSA